MELWEEDLYELIGVNPEATPEEIKKAYKKLAVSLHPDRFPDDEVKRAEAQEKFGKITNAYNILKDEEERAEYDFARRMGYGAMGSAPPPAAAATAAAKPAATGTSASASAAAAAAAEGGISEAKKSQAQNQFDQGKVYHKGKNFQKAIACYKEATRLDPSVADYHAHLGLAYLQQGLKTPANNAFTAAFKIDKKNKIVTQHYEAPDAKGGAKGAKGGKEKGKKDAKGGGSLFDQIMALFGGKKDAKGKKGAPAKKGTAPLKKAGAKK